MALEEISLIINSILCVLSFVLAAVSVITVIVTLKQNSKMINVSNAQINEMRKEHELSLQPVLAFINPEFIIEKPRLFYSPPEDEYSIQSRFGFKVEIRNLSSAIAVNFVCTGISMVKENDELYVNNSCSERINILANEPEKLSYLFLEKERGVLFNSLRERNLLKLPQCELEAVFKNTTGGAFRVKRRYILNPKEEIMDKIRIWHSIISSAEVDYKEELKRLDSSHGKDRGLFDSLAGVIKEKGGEEEQINIECVELDQFFTYEPISIEEYSTIVSQRSFSTFVPHTQKQCVAIEKKRIEKGND